MSEPAMVKAALQRSLRDAEAYIDSLSTLRRQVAEAVGAVTGEIGGSASAADRRAVAELQTAVAELDGLIDGVRRAVVDGRRYAESL